MEREQTFKSYPLTFTCTQRVKKQKITRRYKEHSAIKNINCSYREPGFNSRNPTQQLTTILTPPISRDLTPLLHQRCMWCIYKHADKTTT